MLKMSKITDLLERRSKEREKDLIFLQTSRDEIYQDMEELRKLLKQVCDEIAVIENEIEMEKSCLDPDLNQRIG